MKTLLTTKPPFLPAYQDGCDKFMSASTRLHNKEILLNPVAAYAKSHPGLADENISKLKALSLEIKKLKSQQKKIQEKCKLISRRIGQAKRNGESVDELKASMQAQSKKLEAIKLKIARLEVDILTFFNTEPTSSESKQNSSHSKKNRNYVNQPHDLNAISVSLLKGEQKEWNDYVNNNPAATIYHRIEWLELIQRSHGHEGLYFTARDTEQKIVGILPLIHLQSFLFGNFMVSMPYFNYGGAIANHPLIEQQLMSAATMYAKKRGVSHIEYRDDIPREDLPVRTDKVNMILNLPAHSDKLWAQFTSKLRAQIRRPQKENPNIFFGGEELLNDFYTVFARNMRDLGTPVYDKSFFKNILHGFSEHSTIAVIRMENQPVAAAFLLGYNDILEIPWASTIKDVNHLSMNMLLYWEVLKFAIENRYRQFDFGRSSKDSGTFRFKQQWGAKPKQLYWHYWLAENTEMPRLNPDNPKYALAIGIWKKIPVFITKRLGPAIVRNLP